MATRTNPLGIDSVSVSRDNIRVGTFRLEIEQRVANFAVRRVERVADSIESVRNAQSVDVERDFVQKTHCRKQQRTNQTVLRGIGHVTTL